MISSMIPYENFWNAAGEYPDIHIASVMIMRRNIADVPFRSKMEVRDGQFILNAVQKNASKLFPSKQCIIDADLDENDFKYFNEESLGFASGEPNFDAMLSDGCGNAVAVNGKAHINMYHLMPDTMYFAGFNKLDDLDDRINESLRYAFLPTLGYLFEDPSVCGSGFTIKTLLHLPILSMSAPPDDIMSICYDYDVEVTGLDKTFQLPAVVLTTKANGGDSEQDTCSNLARAVAACAHAERQSRDEYYEKYRNQIDDAVWRSYGLLRHCRMIQWKEASEYLMNLRFGAVMSVLKDIPLEKINRLFYETMPAHSIRRFTGSDFTEDTIIRADTIRSILEQG